LPASIIIGPLRTSVGGNGVFMKLLANVGPQLANGCA
jgi:hypothetical protein